MRRTSLRTVLGVLLTLAVLVVAALSGGGAERTADDHYDSFVTIPEAERP